jgi:hypothetical protein
VKLISPVLTAKLRERLSPRTWALEWLALGVALLGLFSPLWPMSMRERLVAEGHYADAKIERVTRFNQRNQRWGTTKKIGATLPVYLLDLSWSDDRGSILAVSAFHVSDSDAVKIGLDRGAKSPGTVLIRYFSPDGAIAHDSPGRAEAIGDTPPLCYPEPLCERVLLDAVNTIDAKKFGDRPEAGLTVVGLLVFAAMLAVRALALILIG